MHGGQADWNLSERGVKQAKEIGEKLSIEIKEKNYVMYSSDLPRAKQTADIISSYLGAEPILTPALREISLGDANGQTKEYARTIQLIKDEDASIDDKLYNNAESIRDVYNRVAEFSNELMTNQAENIILIAHGISASVFAVAWLGLDVELLNKISISLMGSGSVSFMRQDANGKRVLLRTCDRSYCT